MRTLDDVAIGICHSKRSEESRCETLHLVQDKLCEAIFAR